MIVVRVELHSAVTRKVTELARMHIVNDGLGNATHGNYRVTTFRGRSCEALDKRVVNRDGMLRNWPRESLHVWNLVCRALVELRYQKGFL